LLILNEILPYAWEKHINKIHIIVINKNGLMKRRSFINKSVLATTAITAGATTAFGKDEVKQKDLYELRVYEMRWGQSSLENYFTKALIPFLNSSGIKNVGAFTEIGKSEPAKLYLLIPYGSYEDFIRITLLAKSDATFLKASEEYNSIPMEQAAYARYESSLMMAFDGLPRIKTPEKTNRIFELRTYEGYGEDALRRKVKMFNEGELEIFYRTKLNPVFFGEVIAGGNQPCLTYMITFKNMEEREANWKAFIADLAWEKISKAPEYANTVSRIHKVFLEPLAFSQI
jgi:hypothetical protein